MRGNSAVSGILQVGGGGVEVTDDTAPQFFAFDFDEQTYCIDLISVREIRSWTRATILANTGRYVRSVLNLCGIIVPIVDLRTRIYQDKIDASKSHVVVIFTIEGKLNGLLVDGVSDILSVHETEIMPIPEADSEIRDTGLDGMVALIVLHRVIAEAGVH